MINYWLSNISSAFAIFRTKHLLLYCEYVVLLTAISNWTRGNETVLFTKGVQEKISMDSIKYYKNKREH